MLGTVLGVKDSGVKKAGNMKIAQCMKKIIIASVIHENWTQLKFLTIRKKLINFWSMYSK